MPPDAPPQRLGARGAGPIGKNVTSATCLPRSTAGVTSKVSASGPGEAEQPVIIGPPRRRITAGGRGSASGRERLTVPHGSSWG